MVDVYNKRFNRNIPLTGLDSISLFDVKDLSTLRDFLIKPKPICGYCKCGRGMFLWRESDRSFDEYSFTPDELIQKDPSLYNKFYGNKELLDYSATHTLFKGRRLIDMNDCHFCVGLIDLMNKKYDYDISYGKEPYSYTQEDFEF